MLSQKNKNISRTSLFKPHFLHAFLITYAVLFTPFVKAAPYGWSSWVNVTEAYAASNGNIYVTYTQMYNPGNCSNVGFIAVPASNVAGDRIYSTLLNAMATGQKVLYYVNGCEGIYPKMTHIRIRPPE